MEEEIELTVVNNDVKDQNHVVCDIERKPSPISISTLFFRFSSLNERIILFIGFLCILNVHIL